MEITKERYQEIIERLDRIENTVSPPSITVELCNHIGAYYTTAGWHCPKCGQILEFMTTIGDIFVGPNW